MKMPTGAEDPPAYIVLSLSYRHIAYLMDSGRVETAGHLWLTGLRLALPRAVQMYWAGLGVRIGLLYYCFLIAT